MKDLIQGTGTEMGGNIQGLMIDNMNGKSVGALAYMVSVRAHFFMLDKVFTCYLLHNMFFKQQENNALVTNVTVD